MTTITNFRISYQPRSRDNALPPMIGSERLPLAHSDPSSSHLSDCGWCSLSSVSSRASQSFSSTRLGHRSPEWLWWALIHYVFSLWWKTVCNRRFLLSVPSGRWCPFLYLVSVVSNRFERFSFHNFVRACQLLLVNLPQLPLIDRIATPACAGSALPSLDIPIVILSSSCNFFF